MTRESGEKGSTDAPGLAAPLPGDWVEALRKVLVPLDAQGCKVAFAESCTAGLAASAVSGIEGLGHVLDCAFVTYSDNAKTRLLNVDPAVIADIGAVSQPVARAMAEGVLERSAADVAISVTGFAGPAGPQDEEGLVHFALARTGLPTRCRRAAALSISGHWASIGCASRRSASSSNFSAKLRNDADCRLIRLPPTAVTRAPFAYCPSEYVFAPVAWCRIPDIQPSRSMPEAEVASETKSKASILAWIGRYTAMRAVCDL